mmetsp:Transcript_14044/g.26790  ORF Transcript_14044/g.26790 Transcript_14044/m.26790 type:complete len:369 (+) Transcript_14044:60-1166(+)
MTVWIYHERQEALLCGQHALNNLLQRHAFTPDTLSQIANQLDAMELNFMAQNNEGGVHSKDYLKRIQEGSGNVDEQGNFSVEVLRAALLSRYRLELPNILQKGILDEREITTIDGFICNKSAHWFAIRKINGRYWNLNSTLERPEVISHFQLASEVDKLRGAGYSVFCVVESLPEICTNEAMMDQGLPQYWWKEDDLLKGKTNAMTRADDPWKNVGSGRRLDGKSYNNNGAAASLDVSGMTEDEMLQMAMMASLEQQDPSSASASDSTKSASIDDNTQSYELADEPPEGNPGSIKIQFRLPNGSRAVRRFFKSETVGALYTYVGMTCGKDHRGVELRAGFPPKDLGSRKDETVEDAGLAGEMVHGRIA